jgi:hypothetical protein
MAKYHVAKALAAWHGISEITGGAGMSKMALAWRGVSAA